MLLLLLSLILPLVSGLVTGSLCGKLKVELSAGAYGEKGQEIPARLVVENTSLLPADRLVCRVFCQNLLTGEQEVTALRVAAPARSSAELDLGLASRHAGRIRMTLKQVTCYDLFGLFRFRVRESQNCSATTLVAPHTFDVETQVAYGETADMDSDEYSMRKAGFDPSETFGIREYVPGDRIRQIHWKLTEKLDTLMVRDYGLPIQNTILLLLETGRIPSSPKVSPDCLDALAEAILSVSQELLSQQIVHSIAWFNHEENTFFCREVETEEDLSLLMPDLLGAVPGEDALSVADHYMESREQVDVAHVLIFTPQHRSSLSFLAGQCLLTELVCSPGAGGYDQEDGVAILGTEPGKIAETLAYVEF